jgi:hypothetical protein
MAPNVTALRWPLVAALLAAACGQDVAPPPIRNLDRPSEMTFACWGDLRLADGSIIRTAQPMSACEARARGEVPPGQEGVPSPEPRGFVLETARGTVAVVNPIVHAVLDSDPLTPGKNSIPVGTLPVGLVSDASGCYMMTASSGSCDLTAVHVNTALEITEVAATLRRPVTAGGLPLLARPRAMAAFRQAEEPVACPAPDSGTPTGVVYVAYPECGLVAAIDAATGEVRAGLSFAEDGTVAITDGAVECPAQCGGAAIAAHGGAEPDAGPAPDAGAVEPIDGRGRPVAVTYGPDGKLYVGADNQPRLVAVTLDDAGLPIATSDVVVEGGAAVGLLRIAVSEPIAMGGDEGPPGDTLAGDGGVKQFAYAIATDRSVRVIELTAGIECDTQVDPRGLVGVTDVARLACLPVGDPATPPRRATARSPGIVLPRDAVPLDVAFSTVLAEEPPVVESPFTLHGTFAFISSSDGFLFIANVDDDSYPDFERPGAPSRVQLPLALAHQVRDIGRLRDELPGSCAPPAGDSLQFGPRLRTPPAKTVASTRIAPGKTGLLPGIRQVACDVQADPVVPVAELEFAAPEALRETVYPDFAALRAESWYLIWEGSLSIDGPGQDIDGPVVRRGVVTTEGGMALTDAASPFCEAGLEPFDVVGLVGCDPATGNTQCGVGETCYVHPESSSAVTSGQCLPTARLDALSGRCRDFLVGLRRYAVRDLEAGRVGLMARRRVLRTTPIEGCASAAQCGELAAIEATLADPEHPVAVAAPDVPNTWSCGADPSRPPGIDRCMMTCDSSADCEAGTLCAGGFCVEGVVPPGECVTSVQRYQVRAGEAFVLIGDRTGYLHGRTRDPATNRCVADPAASPLLVGRVPLRVPPCLDPPAVSPNPCATELSHVERVTPFEVVDGVCRARPDVVASRQAQAIRVENPALRFHLIDPVTTGDAVCNGDRAGTAPPFAAVYPGYQIELQVTGGLVPMIVPGVEAALPAALGRSPDGRIWVVDQGDASASTNGRLFVLDPNRGPDGFGLIVIL